MNFLSKNEINQIVGGSNCFKLFQCVYSKNSVLKAAINSDEHVFCPSMLTRDDKQNAHYHIKEVSDAQTLSTTVTYDINTCAVATQIIKNSTSLL